MLFLRQKKNISLPCKPVTNGSLVTMDFLCYSKHLGAIKTFSHEVPSYNWVNNVFPWLNLARHWALQIIFHLIWQNKTRIYTSPIVFLSYFRNHIDIQRTFATLHSHWKLAHKKRCVDKMLKWFVGIWSGLFCCILTFCPSQLYALCSL